MLKNKEIYKDHFIGNRGIYNFSFYRTIQKGRLPYFACILITNNAVYIATSAIPRPMMTEAMSPDCLIAQGTESNEVPIIVFQIAKLKVLMFDAQIYPQ